MANSSPNIEGSHLVVAAFDFGTTYSGYAYSYRHNRSNVFMNNRWIAGSSELMSLKTPTCILLDPEEKFDSFGFEAEDKYSDLAEDNKHHGWLFFRRFKMLLHNNKKLSKKTTIQDINGKRLYAIDIFSMSIRYLRGHFLRDLRTKVTNIEESDIKYVITIPAIWDDSGKQFMRLAAEKADIDTERLKLALEPEAASIWCQTLRTEANDSLVQPGAQYMVIDLGGGTSDISVHEKSTDGTLKEMHKASGGPWGGMEVDNNFIAWFEQLLGKNTMERFKLECIDEYIDMLRGFELHKRSIQFDTQEYISVRIPSVLRDVSEKENGKTLGNQIYSSSFASSIEIKRDKFRIKVSVVKRWFDGPTDNIISLIREILHEPNMKRVSAVLLVGGLGESAYVQEKIRNAILNKSLIVPEEAGLAVLKGAVTFGHQPSILSERVMKYSYGIGIYDIRCESQNHESNVVFINGQTMVKDSFLLFIRAGETAVVGRKCKQELVPTNMDFTHLPIYCSADSNPSFTTDPACKYVGSLTVHHSEGNTLSDKEFKVVMIFGDTEIKVKARIKKTGKMCRTVLDMF